MVLFQRNMLNCKQQRSRSQTAVLKSQPLQINSSSILENLFLILGIHIYKTEIMIHTSQCSCEDKLKEYLKSLAQCLAQSQHSETHGFIFLFSMILSMEFVVSMDLLSNLRSFISQFYPKLARQACVCVCVCVPSCLFVTPQTVAHQTSLSVGFSR